MRGEQSPKLKLKNLYHVHQTIHNAKVEKISLLDCQLIARYPQNRHLLVASYNMKQVIHSLYVKNHYVTVVVYDYSVKKHFGDFKSILFLIGHLSTKLKNVTLKSSR